MEMVSMGPPHEQTPDIELLLEYMPLRLESVCAAPQGAEMYKVWDARSLVLDRDKFFNR